ncbi:MAG: CDP-alcohol phosphatidyltransferase family protein [Bacteroidales bacterium]|nr:CDP-alcohol phosphatidyltransferase family protein [Bacteroidales bacterium]MBR0291669.1 CDP-alcohol phosphatidyltransferase family protein [Bacteroidales bacterium]
METKQAQRIQTSVLNAAERKLLVWLAERQPRWMTSDALTFIGTFGAAVTGLGFMLSDLDIRWLWLSSLGLLINWYGDSLDGTLARVRKTQRPLYGYYLDHTVDCINESLMFIGAGLSQLVRLDFTLFAYIIYLFLTINVSINAHLKGEFKLTYAKMGPTEFRLIMVIVNTLMIFVRPLQTFALETCIIGRPVVLRTFDLLALAIILILSAMYICTIISDARNYSKVDPPKKVE